jgi:hypothetical protein
MNFFFFITQLNAKAKRNLIHGTVGYPTWVQYFVLISCAVIYVLDIQRLIGTLKIMFRLFVMCMGHEAHNGQHMPLLIPVCDYYQYLSSPTLKTANLSETHI